MNGRNHPGHSMERLRRSSCRGTGTLAIGACPFSCHSRRRRRGAILVWFALTLVALLGLTGLVIDGGYLMATHRQLQTVADAAALAAADELLRGLSPAQASDAAVESAKQRHGLPQAEVVVNIPPAAGPYQAQAGYVEVVVDLEVPTLFVHVMPGTAHSQHVRGRAVAGIELARSSYGVLLLDPDARPGLSVTGNARLAVRRGLAINSEGGGVDERGQPVGGPGNSTAAFVSRFALVSAPDVRVVGGVNNPDGFQNYTPGLPNPLRAGQLPVSDPLVRLPTPTVANGVVNVRRGAPRATAGTLELNNAEDDSASPNYLYADPVTGEQVMVLQPGIYSSISITGGRVQMVPGIYVVAAPPGTVTSVEITGGQLQAQGIMFYNTRQDYDPLTGQPDVSAQVGDATAQGQIRLNASLGFTPLDTRLHSYPAAPAAINAFDGMLIYQRRDHAADIQLHGFGVEDDFRGTVYAPGASVWLPSRGAYDAQFIVGSMRIPGHGNISIDFDEAAVAQGQLVFLVE